MVVLRDLLLLPIFQVTLLLMVHKKVQEERVMVVAAVAAAVHSGEVECGVLVVM